MIDSLAKALQVRFFGPALGLEADMDIGHLRDQQRFILGSHLSALPDSG